MKRYRKDDTRFMTDEEKAQRIKDINIRNPYTERQKSIINETAFNVGKGEVNKLIKKAEDKGQLDLASELYEKYEELITGRRKAKYKIDEANKILNDLSPWER